MKAKNRQHSIILFKYKRPSKNDIKLCILYNESDASYILNDRNSIDLSPFEWNFDLDKSGQKFHHSLKEHHKISNIPKFRCEML
jgi:hypothetical protein